MSRSLSQLAQSLRTLPRTVALKVADQAAPVLTVLAKETFDASETPLRVDWAPSATGERVTLRKSGALASFIRYVAIGAKLRVSLGTRYAKYQIGKRAVFPRQGEALPKPYSDALKTLLADVVRKELGK